MRLIDADAAVDALRDYLVEKRCPDDGTLACRLIENEVINKLPSIQSDDDRLERCRFEYVNACKILAHRTPDTRKKDIDDAYAVVRTLNPIFGEEGF